MSSEENCLDFNGGDSTDGTKVPACVKLEQSDLSTCCMCHDNENDSLKYGDMYKLDDVVCHYFCLLFSSSLVQKGEDHEGIFGFFPKDINVEIKRGSRLKCNYCRRNGATIGCCVKSCRKTFHLPCGLKHGSMHQFYDQFRSYCSLHRPSQNISPKIKKTQDGEEVLICPICYESVPNEVSNDTLWGPCCKKRWFHRICLQNQALAQGYFFKCPMCNNKDKFNSEMKKFGIYIPEMDAAWEREPNAFQDLLVTYRNCDASVCKCPDGRKFAQNTGSWRLLRCNACGSQGTHIVCSGLKMAAANNSWRCTFCEEVLFKANIRRNESELLEAATSSQPVTITHSSSSCVPHGCTSSSQRRHADADTSSLDKKRWKSSSPYLKSEISYSSTTQPSGSYHSDQKLSEEKARGQYALPGPSCDMSSDEDEVVVVDDSESDIEVVDEVIKKEPVQLEKTSNHFRAPPNVEKELLTKDGQKIKVHMMAAESESVGGELENLGTVKVQPPVKDEPDVSKIRSTCSDIIWERTQRLKVPVPNVSIYPVSVSKASESSPYISDEPNVNPSTSKESSSSPSVIQKTVSASSETQSSSQKTLNPSNSEPPPSELVLKIGNVRHSNELFSSPKTEEQRPSAAQSNISAVPLQHPTQPFHLSNQGNSLVNLPQGFSPSQQIMWFPTKTADGRPAMQPYFVPFPMAQPQQPPPQNPPGHQQRRLASARSSSDIVELD